MQSRLLFVDLWKLIISPRFVLASWVVYPRVAPGDVTCNGEQKILNEVNYFKESTSKTDNIVILYRWSVFLGIVAASVVFFKIFSFSSFYFVFLSLDRYYSNPNGGPTLKELLSRIFFYPFLTSSWTSFWSDWRRSSTQFYSNFRSQKCRRRLLVHSTRSLQNFVTQSLIKKTTRNFYQLDEESFNSLKVGNKCCICAV